MLGGLAEFERELILARTGEGRARAKARGVKMGRKPKLTPHQRQEALKRLLAGEETTRDIGRSYNVVIQRYQDLGEAMAENSAIEWTDTTWNSVTGAPRSAQAATIVMRLGFQNGFVAYLVIRLKPDLISRCARPGCCSRSNGNGRV